MVAVSPIALFPHLAFTHSQLAILSCTPRTKAWCLAFQDPYAALQPAVCDGEQRCTKGAQKKLRASLWPDPQGFSWVGELLRWKGVAGWHGVCTKLDPSVIIQWHTEFHFGSDLRSLDICSGFILMKIKGGFFQFFFMVLGSRHSAMAAEIWLKTVHTS